MNLLRQRSTELSVMNLMHVKMLEEVLRSGNDELTKKVFEFEDIMALGNDTQPMDMQADVDADKAALENLVVVDPPVIEPLPESLPGPSSYTVRSDHLVSLAKSITKK